MKCGGVAKDARLDLMARIGEVVRGPDRGTLLAYPGQQNHRQVVCCWPSAQIQLMVLFAENIFLARCESNGLLPLISSIKISVLLDLERQTWSHLVEVVLGRPVAVRT